MSHETHIIMGIHVTDRMREAGAVQRVLTEYGCNIKTRVGLHHVDDHVCSPRGLILLELFGGPSVADAMASRLKAIEGVDVQTMIFPHDFPSPNGSSKSPAGGGELSGGS